MADDIEAPFTIATGSTLRSAFFVVARARARARARVVVYRNERERERERNRYYSSHLTKYTKKNSASV